MTEVHLWVGLLRPEHRREAALVGERAARLGAALSEGIAVPETVLLLGHDRRCGDGLGAGFRLLSARFAILAALDLLGGGAGSGAPPCSDAPKYALRDASGLRPLERRSAFYLGLTQAAPGDLAAELSRERGRRRARYTAEVRHGARFSATSHQLGEQELSVDELTTLVLSLLAGAPVQLNKGFEAYDTSCLLFQRMRPGFSAPGDAVLRLETRGCGHARHWGYARVLTPAGRVELWPADRLRDETPSAFKIIDEWCDLLETVARSACVLDVGIDRDVPFLLSVRRGTAPPEAHLGLLEDHLSRGLYGLPEALASLDPASVGEGEAPEITNRDRLTPHSRGFADGREVATGRVAFGPAGFVDVHAAGDPVVFACGRLVPEVTPFLSRIAGLIAEQGGVASHVAVIAHGMGIPMLLGIDVSGSGTQGSGDGNGPLVQGEWVTIDEPSGTLFRGRAQVRRAATGTSLTGIEHLARGSRRMRVFANASRSEEVRLALERGADGIGLYRSENLLADDGPGLLFRAMVLARDPLPFAESLAAEMSTSLASTLRLASPRPVYYRLLDAPLDEYLPPPPAQRERLAALLEIDPEDLDLLVRARAALGGPFGVRGLRWSIPNGFCTTQVSAALRAVEEVLAEGREVSLVIVAPMVALRSELEFLRAVVLREIAAATALGPIVSLASMVETPRAALISAELAPMVHSLCFGTNDLTQAIWAMSRDQIPPSGYASCLGAGPFETLDVAGVGRMLELAFAQARVANREVRLCVCGEQAGDPESIEYLVGIGADAISVSPRRLRTASVAAARAELAPIASAPSLPLGDSAGGLAAAGEDAFRTVESAVRLGDWDGAQSVTRAWMEGVSLVLGLRHTAVWKYFKRDLAALWFGAPEFRRFSPNWTANEVQEYASLLRNAGRVVRYSLFPVDIACYSATGVLDPSAPLDAWLVTLGALDNRQPMEVFPQQDTSNLCFRAVLRGRSGQIEAGIGQAVNVFELERGTHSIVSARCDISGQLLAEETAVRGTNDTSAEVRIGLQRLLQLHGEWIFLGLRDCSDRLGLRWLAAEGYFNRQTLQFPCVVDLDLPHDLAFHAPEGSTIDT